MVCSEQYKTGNKPFFNIFNLFDLSTFYIQITVKHLTQ